MRKIMIISTKTCFRAICNHPFLVGMVFFLILLYRLSPLGFSIFLGASPVFVCTAILLGVLLSFGQPNVVETEKEEKSRHEISSLKTKVVQNAPRHVAKQKDCVHNAVQGATSVNNEINEIQEDVGSIRSVPSINESSRDIQCEKMVIKEVEKETDVSMLEKKRGIHVDKAGCSHGKVLEDQVRKVGGGNLRGKDDNSCVERGGIHKDDNMDSPLLSSWKRMGHDDGAESDGAESSSPDASMAEIIPMLDELHPLLDSKVELPTRLSDDGSDDVSERSHTSSNDGSAESDENTETPGVAKGGEEDGSKSVIKWTEDDQKNLMNLGTSELERNQRLENLIARRRASKGMKLMTEKNLIDLDSADLSFGIPPISVKRRNPFDIPCNDYDNRGLLPIPVSAPSILQPRQNPFDLPYDSTEEKHDLKDDRFHQEFSAFHQRDAFFRRHDSFGAGPSTLGGIRPDLKWPYFIPERLASEGIDSGSLMFERQLSEMSESKMSSVPDSESVCSAMDGEEKKQDEGVTFQEVTSIHDEGSQSSEEISLDTEQAENRDAHHDEVEVIPGNVESLQERESNLSDAGVPTHLEYDPSEIHSRMEEAVEDGYSSRSNSSSSTEPDEKISGVKEEESATRVVDDNLHKEPVYDSSPPSDQLSSSDSKIGADIHHDVDVEVVSSNSRNQAGPSTDKSSLELEKQRASSQKSISEPSFAGQDRTKEPFPTNAESEEKVNHVDFNVKNVVLEETKATKSEENKLEQLPILEAKSMDDIDMAFKQLREGAEVEEVILPSMIKESTNSTGTNPKLPALEAKSMDDIDMAFKQLHEGADVEEVILPTMINESKDSADGNSQLPALEARSVDDINMAFKQLHQGTDVEEVVLPSMIKDSIDSADAKSQLPALEVRSVDDINMAFKQLQEGTDIEEVILPSMIKESTGSADTNTQLPGLEVRSIDDIDVAFKQLRKGTDVEEVILPSMIKESTGSADGDSQLPALEARSVDDINMAFKQLHEGTDVEEVILPSMIKESSGSADGDLQLPALEARSVDDINMAFKQLHEGAHVEEVILPSMIKESTGSADNNSQLPALEVRSIDDIDMAFKQLNEGADVDEVILPSMIKDSVDSTDINSHLPIVEAKSVEDMHVALKRVSESCLGDNHDMVTTKNVQSSSGEATVPSKYIESSSGSPSVQESSKDSKIKSLDEAGGSHSVVSSIEFESNRGKSSVQGSSKEPEINSGDQAGSSHSVAPGKEVKSSVQGSNKDPETKTSDAAGGSHSLVPDKEAEASVQGSSKDPETKTSDEAGGSHSLVPSKEAKASVQGSKKDPEIKTNDEAGGGHSSLVHGKEVESSVQGSSKDPEIKTGDEAGGSHSTVPDKEVKSSVQGSNKDPETKTDDKAGDNNSEVPAKSVWRFW